MEVVSVSALPVASILWQKGQGSWVLTVVCKATFDLVPGEATLADDQEAPTADDEYWNDDPSRSLRVPGDLVPAKPRADVILVGSAYAPGGVPVRSLVARLVVSKVDKSIEAVADRALSGREVQEGAGFTRIPLVYERAAGGPGTTNPVGVRRDARDAYGRITLPNLQAPGSRPEAIEPIGFGPLAPLWPQRMERLGRHAASWSPSAWNGRPLPGDVDLAHFNVAPPDQQVAALRENERLVLENLSREHPRLTTMLPGVRPCAFVEGRTGAPIRLPMHADTLWIDTDRAVCTLVWRRQLPLERPDEQGRVVVALEQPGQTLSWPDVAPLLPMELEPDEEEEKPELSTLVPPAGATPTGEQTMAAFKVPVPAATLPFNLDAPAPTNLRQGQGQGGHLPFVAAASAAAASPWVEPAESPKPPPIDSPWMTGTAAFVAPGPAPGPVTAALPGAKVEAWAAVRPEPLPVAAPARAEVTEVLELLWFDGDSVARIRRNPEWKPILAALEEQPADRDLDDPLADAPMEMENRREVFEILARGAAGDAAGVDRALDAAVRKDGKFVAQLGLFSGQLEFAFDELETLKATLAAVAPLASPADEALKAAVEAAKEFVQSADELTHPSVAEAMTARLREAFSPARRNLPDTHLAEQTDRVLLGQRRYQKRIVFGAPHLRCLVHLGGGAPVPAYLPEALAKSLPMFQRFKGRLIAEVQQQADQYETHHASLRVVALARATPPRPRW